MSSRLGFATAGLGAALLAFVAAAAADSRHAQGASAGQSPGFAAGDSRSGAPRGKLALVAEPDHDSGGYYYPAEVYVVDVDGTHLRNLTHDRASNGFAQWLPDGKRIVFASRQSWTGRKPHIFVINSDGTHRRRLTSSTGGEAPDVSPNGRRIAFFVQRGSRGAFYVMDADGRHKRRVLAQKGFDELVRLAWSSDGGLLMFIRQDLVRGDDTRSLFVMNSNGTGLTRLERSSTLADAVWSPTRRTLAIQHGRVTVADLQRRGGRLVLRFVKRFRNVDTNYGSLEWTPDGRSIVYGNGNGNTWVVDARHAKLRRRFPVQMSYWAWSPDGRWLASGFPGIRKGGILISTATGHDRRRVPRKRICCLLDQIAWSQR